MIKDNKLLKKIIKKHIKHFLLENADDIDTTPMKSINDEITIPAEYLHNFQSVVIDINNKLSMKNVKFEIKILKTFEKRISNNPTGKIFHKIKIEGRLPIINNYEFIAKIEHLEHGNVINCNPSLKDTDQIISKYGHSTQQCDVCKTTRDRNNTFILKNIKTDETFTVGSTCLKKFVTIEDATSFFDIAKRLSEMLEMFNKIKHGLSMGAGNDSYLSSGWKNNKSGTIPISELLLYGCISILSTGSYRKKDDIDSTYNDTINLMYGFKTSDDDDRLQKYYVKAGHMRDDIINFIHEFDFETAASRQLNMSTYFHNLKVLTSGDSVTTKNAGFILSIIPMYQRYSKNVNNKDVADNGYLGSKGDKINVDVKVINVKPIETIAGTRMNIYTMTDKENHSIVAFVNRNTAQKDDYDYIKTPEDDLLKSIYLSGDYQHISAIVKKTEKNKYNNYEDTTYISNISSNIMSDDDISKVSEYIGNVGDKITTEVRITNINEFESTYGQTYLYSMEDKQGNKIAWFGSRLVDELREILTDPIFIKIKGTIKKTEPNKYENDAKTTYLTRVKVVN